MIYRVGVKIDGQWIYKTFKEKNFFLMQRYIDRCLKFGDAVSITKKKAKFKLQ